MKKFMLAAMAALAITSCSQSEEFDAPSSKKEIGFTTAVTRGTVLTTGQFREFKAFGYAFTGSFSSSTEGTKIMDGTYTSTDGMAWSEKENQKFYWPLEDKVSFFGYSPVVTEAVYEYTSPGYPSVSYAVNADIAKQADFVVAKDVDGKTITDASVNLSFKHALAQVLIKLKASDSNLTYKVSKVTLKGLKNTGKYSFETNEWTASGEATNNYAMTFGTVKVVTGSDALELAANEELMILMPQDLNDVTVDVTFSTFNGLVQIGAESTKSANIETLKWETGNKYVYTVLLSGGTKIDVTGSVDTTWTPKSEDVTVN